MASTLIGGLLVFVAGLSTFLYTRKQKKDAAERGLQELNNFRQVRLDKSKAEFAKRNHNIDALKKNLSSGAKVATVDECTSLPVHMHAKRFYTADDLAASSSSTSRPSEYSIWIDRVWNKDVLCFPQIIVKVATAEDVAACLKFVHEHAPDLNISVAGGAHSASAFADGALTIDLSQMSGVVYDETSKECSVDGGTLLKEVDKVCNEHGRCIPVGTNGDTGISGLTLSGGNGWLSRKFGLTVDNLVAIDVVLPDGTIHKNIRDDAPPSERDILWACRGSGGHFGVVTKFYFTTHPIPNENQYLLGTVVPLCPTTTMKKNVILSWWNKINAASIETQSFLVLPAGAPVVPTMWLHMGVDAVKGKAALEATKDLEGSTSLGGLFNAENSWKVIDHAHVQKLIEDKQGHGFLYQSIVVLTELTGGVASCLAENIAIAPPGSVLIVGCLGGKVVTNDAGCRRCSISTRSAKAYIIVESRWDPLGPDGNEVGRAKCQKWCRDFVSNVNSKNPGAIAKTTHAFSDAADENAGEHGNNALVDITNAEVAKRLRKIKLRVDPDNILCHNRKLSSK